MTRARPHRSDYRYFLEILTRWGDNDAYGHAGNVVYYSWYETVLSRWLIEVGAVDMGTTPIIGVMAENGCRFHAPVAFPDRISVALRAERIGNTSVRFGMAVFRGNEDTASASGHAVHVYVDRATQRLPQPLQEDFRRALEAILVAPSA